MRRRGRARAAVLSLSTALSLVLGWAVWSWWDGRQPAGLEFHEVGDDLEKIRRERAVYAAERTAASADPFAVEPTERPYYLTEEHAYQLFGLANKPEGLHLYDPYCYVVQKAFRDAQVPWKEHPERKYTLATNEDGLRDDPIDWDADPDLRVLVAGDSHTFGVCSNDESYPNRLEQLLAEAWPGRSFDVLNTGQGGYSFYHYLGMLEKYRYLEPDVFVLGIFGGNDFSEISGLARTFGEGPPAHFTSEQRDLRRRSIETVSRAALGQCLTGTFYFEHHPEHVAAMSDIALDLARQMRALCEARGARMVVAFIPAPCNLKWDAPIPKVDEAREFLQLEPDAVDVLDEVADRFLDRMRAEGVPVVDLRETIAGLDVPPYWRHDLHLDVTGHDLLARELQPVVEQIAFELGALPRPDDPR